MGPGPGAQRGPRDPFYLIPWSLGHVLLYWDISGKKQNPVLIPEVMADAGVGLGGKEGDGRHVSLGTRNNKENGSSRKHNKQTTYAEGHRTKCENGCLRTRNTRETLMLQDTQSNGKGHATANNG